MRLKLFFSFVPVTYAKDKTIRIIKLWLRLSMRVIIFQETNLMYSGELISEFFQVNDSGFF